VTWLVTVPIATLAKSPVQAISIESKQSRSIPLNVTSSTLIVSIAVLLSACGATDDGPPELTCEPTHVELETFQMTEVVPNTTLSTVEQVSGSKGLLVRTEDALQFGIDTVGLPAGVYTFWLHLLHADGEESILWSGNDIVEEEGGSTTLYAELTAGIENAPGEIFIGEGLQPDNAAYVAVELWVRDHGPASDDPVVLDDQLHMPFGGCTDERNPTPRPDDYPCWNPQRAVFGVPATPTGGAICP
jgi:hypothetical protein